MNRRIPVLDEGPEQVLRQIGYLLSGQYLVPRRHVGAPSTLGYGLEQLGAIEAMTGCRVTEVPRLGQDEVRPWRLAHV